MDEGAVSQELVQWYKKNGRDLPWRHTRDPYEVLVSEVMLQQTRVPTVEKRYASFLSRFPTIESLAQADEGDVLKEWEGLGYYRRARNLHAAAKHVCEKHGGVLPSSDEDLLAMPGIGQYTAAAIRALCFGEPVPALDANAYRVFSRLLAIEDPVGSAALHKKVAEAAQECLHGVDPGDFAQAVMDLSSLICTKAPQCAACPLQDICNARRQGIQDRLPVRKPKAERKCERITMLAFVRNEERIGLQLRPDDGLLGSMYGFVCLEGHLDPIEALVAACDMDEGTACLRPGPSWQHAFTHVVWDVQSYVVATYEGPKGLVWADPEELECRYAIPSAFAPLARANLLALGWL